MNRLSFFALLVLAVIGYGWYATRAVPLPAETIAGLTGDAENGALVFAAAGCASCHVGEDTRPNVMAGGKRFVSDFGTFVAPNISNDFRAGVGAWSDLELASAIMRGTTPNGNHLYPAFPYAAYTKATPQDVVDLIAHMRTLPASNRQSEPHDLGFPFNQRATVGVWKWMFMNTDWVLQDTPTRQLERGRYLVEALGHCAECHTPRTALGGLDTDRWMAGAPNPSGEGRIPNITGAALTWSEEEIAIYLQSGFTPEFDSAGGSMAAVIRNTALLSDEDRSAMAAYLKAIPPLDNAE